MRRNKDELVRYYENIRYGNKSKPIEVHGPNVAAAGRQQIQSLVTMYDTAMEAGESQLADMFKNAVYSIATQFRNLKSNKEEHSQNVELGSNWCTTYGWDDNFFTEKGGIRFDENNTIICQAMNPLTGQMEEKYQEDITKDWESIGDWMQVLIDGKQELIKAKNDLKKDPPFNIDFFVSNLLKRNWKSILSDQDLTLDPNGISNGYRLQQILHEEADENGNLPADYNLDKNSFNPEIDTRLHTSIANELKRAFDPNWQSESEVIEGRQLMSRINI